MALIRFMRLLLTILAIVTLAAAAPNPTKTVLRFSATSPSPTCVDGVPASLPSEGSWPINYATVTPTAAALAASYKLDTTWRKAHSLNDDVSSQMTV